MAAFARKLASFYTRSLRGALSVPHRHVIAWAPSTIPTLENPACATGANPPASCVCSHTTFPRGAQPFTSAPTEPALPEPCPRGIPHATIPWRAFMRRFHGEHSWNLRSTCSRNPRLREPSATEQAVTFCYYAKQPGIERCCAHHTCLAASVRIVSCKCAAPRLLASVNPRRDHPSSEHVLCGMEEALRRSNKDGSCSKSRSFSRSDILCARDTLEM